MSPFFLVMAVSILSSAADIASNQADVRYAAAPTDGRKAVEYTHWIQAETQHELGILANIFLPDRLVVLLCVGHAAETVKRLTSCVDQRKLNKLCVDG